MSKLELLALVELFLVLMIGASVFELVQHVNEQSAWAFGLWVGAALFFWLGYFLFSDED